MDKSQVNLKRIRALDYSKDPDPQHWKTINGSHVHLDKNGNYDGGAGGKFNGNHHYGTGYKQKAALMNRLASALHAGVNHGNSASENSNTAKIEQLDKQIKELEKMKNNLDAEGDRILKESYSGSTFWNGHEGEQQKFYKARHESQQIKSRLAELGMRRHELEEAGKKDEPKTFANGFGEATHREITSATYERAQKRLDKRLASLLGTERGNREIPNYSK